MIKTQYVVRPTARLSRREFRQRAMDRLVPALLERADGPIKLTLTADEVPPISVIPFRRQPVALVTMWTTEPQADNIDWTPILSREGRVSGYRVAESVPLAYERDWPDRSPTPGVGLLTLFSRRRGLDRQTFIERWHGSHTPLSLKIHPMWSYVRNEIQTPVLEGSPPLDAIVEEHFRSRGDLLNPLRFFGGATSPSPVRALPNMARVALDIRRFIDLRSLESHLVTEHHLRS